MRFVDYETILEQIAAMLETKVLPALDDVEARQQSWAAIGLLDNIASRMRDQELRIGREVGLLEALLLEAPPGLVTVSGEVDSGSDVALRQLRRDLADRLSRALSDLAGSQDPAPEVAAWLDRCGEVLLEIEAGEMERMRATRYYQSMRG